MPAPPVRPGLGRAVGNVFAHPEGLGLRVQETTLISPLGPVLARAKATLTAGTGAAGRSPTGHTKRARITRATRKQVAMLYESGLSTRAIAERTHMAGRP